MKFKTRVIFIMVFFLLLFAGAENAFSIPLPDLTPHKCISFSLDYYSYGFDNPPPIATSAPDWGIEYGYKKVEFGVEYIPKTQFVESGFYPGKTAWNVKWRILTDGSDPVSLIAGSLYLGSKKYTNQYYGPSPYMIFSKSYKGLRFHLGYQDNLLGSVYADTDNKKSRGMVGGVDGTLFKHPKHPVFFIVDFAKGPMATHGITLSQPINRYLTWVCSMYTPFEKRLPVSGDELPVQKRFGLYYTVPIK